MSKLQFEYLVLAPSKDAETKTIVITSICTENGKKNVLPEELGYVRDYDQSRRTKKITKLTSSLKRRNQIRKV